MFVPWPIRDVVDQHVKSSPHIARAGSDNADGYR
jgi:hypothetical protein